MSGLHILGFSADMINNVVFKNTMSLTLTNDVIRTCDTKTKFKKALYDCLGSWIIEDNFDLYDFSYNETVGGICLKYGSDIDTNFSDTPLFKTKSIPVPKTFTIGYYYENYMGYDANGNKVSGGGYSPNCNLQLRITTESKGTTNLFQLRDNGNGDNSTNSVKIYVNNGKTVLTEKYGNGTFKGEQTFIVPDQVPNCVSTTDKECVLELFNALYAQQGKENYTNFTGFPYITSLQMDFS